MKKWVVIGIVVLGVLGIGYEIWNQSYSNGLVNFTSRDSSSTEVSPWILFNSISADDTDGLYEVIWDQKYGTTKKVYCKAIFKNDKTNQFKLIAPWLEALIIESQNTNDMKINKVSKKDAPDYSNNK